MTRWVEAAFARQDAAAAPDPGRVTARRLNRAEYDNTVRDLLGVELRPGQDFPQDDSGYGFDNNGDVLSLSPALMERYLIAAERVARAALFGPEAPRPGLVRSRSTRARVEPCRRARRVRHDGPHAAQRRPRRVPLPGDRRLRRARDPGRRATGRLRAGRGRPLRGRPQQGVSRSTPRASAPSAIDRQDFTGKTRELRVKLTAGEHRLSGTIVRLFEGLPRATAGRTLRSGRCLRRAIRAAGTRRRSRSPRLARRSRSDWPRWRRPTT